ncbi:endonuclease domain-containing protein [Bradyrhizobium oligotrophicum]|uniref:endonuclease domain-containing protein n=1 Tax=Bradyrhizobium TaxID=374 RepID=UPI003EB893A4
MPHAVVSNRQRNRAKQLRQAMTRAETLLWRYIKADRIDGASFRRQVPFRNYIADFACFSAKPVIELDGESHDFTERQARDAERDAFFAAEGFEVLRFTNEQVTSNLEGVVAAIRQAIADRARGLPPSPPLPHKGGGSGESVASDQDSEHDHTHDTNTSKIRGMQP